MGEVFRARDTKLGHDVAIKDGLPGAELIAKGIAELARSEETVESRLVSIGAPKLRFLWP